MLTTLDVAACMGSTHNQSRMCKNGNNIITPIKKTRKILAIIRILFTVVPQCFAIARYYNLRRQSSSTAHFQIFLMQRIHTRE